MARYLLIGILVVGTVYLATAWPRINDVETGRTPEYPELRVREYGADEATVARAVERVIARLSRFTFVGAGRGPGGAEVQAVAASRLLRFKDDVTVQIRRVGGKTRVSVRSRSRMGRFDLGQNARNIKELLAELDKEVAREALRRSTLGIVIGLEGPR